MSKKETLKQEVKKVETKQKSKFKTVSENLPFHNFQENPEFTGIFENQITLGENEPFQVFIMADIETGERKFITASHSIEKCIAKVKAEHENLSDIVFNFVFIGKTEVKGKPFNQFNTGFCTIEEYNS